MKMTGKKNRKTVSMAFDFIRNGIVVPHVSVSGSFYHRVAAVLIRLTQGIISCHLFSNFPIKKPLSRLLFKRKSRNLPFNKKSAQIITFSLFIGLGTIYQLYHKNCQTYVFASKIRSCQMNQGGSLMANP